MVPNGMFVELEEFPSYYVTDTGEVWSSKPNPNKQSGFRKLKAHVDKDGYHRVRIVDKCGKIFGKGVHRLVLLAFEGDSPLTVNHKNGNKDDNTLENLEYMTNVENLKHAYRTGLSLGGQRGSKSNLARHTEEKIAQIMDLKGKMSGHAAGRLTGVSYSYVCSLWKGEKHKRGIRQVQT